MNSPTAAPDPGAARPPDILSSDGEMAARIRRHGIPEASHFTFAVVRRILTGL